MKIILILSVALSVFILSCKKKDDSANINDSEKISEAGSTTGNASTTPTSNASSFNGLLTIESAISPQTQKFLVKVCTAYFSATPTITSGTNGLMVNQVLFEGDTLYSGGTLYSRKFDSTFTGNKWDIIGGSGIPTFSFDATFSDPVCIVNGGLPDSISKSSGFTISINVGNSKSASLSLTYDARVTGGPIGSITFPLSNGINNLTITSAQLNVLPGPTNGYFMIYADNESNHIIGGKDFSFRKRTMLFKNLKITN